MIIHANQDGMPLCGRGYSHGHELASTLEAVNCEACLKWLDFIWEQGNRQPTPPIRTYPVGEVVNDLANALRDLLIATEEGKDTPIEDVRHLRALCLVALTKKARMQPIEEVSND